MIISEKQVMELIAIATQAMHMALPKGSQWYEWTLNVGRLLDKINAQQSEKLKHIE